MKETTCKCKVCNKKLRELMIQMHTCRCKGIYCSLHKHSHNCEYDYSSEKQHDDKISSKKIEKI